MPLQGGNLVFIRLLAGGARQIRDSTLLAIVLCVFQYRFAQVTSWPIKKH
jgi:hypothetical protein